VRAIKNEFLIPGNVQQPNSGLSTVLKDITYGKFGATNSQTSPGFDESRSFYSFLPYSYAQKQLTA
jgi:hypothetical protein